MNPILLRAVTKVLKRIILELKGVCAKGLLAAGPYSL